MVLHVVTVTLPQDDPNVPIEFLVPVCFDRLVDANFPGDVRDPIWEGNLVGELYRPLSDA